MARLTPAQLTALKIWYQANAAGETVEVAAALANALVSPDYFCWRTSLSRHELTDKSYVADDGIATTSFVWGGATGGYIARSQGERDAFAAIFNASDNCSPSLANVRTAFDDIFSGAGAGAVANRAQVRGAGRRAVTIAEKLFATATVGGPSQSGSRGSRTNPDTLNFEGQVTSQDFVDAQV